MEEGIASLPRNLLEAIHELEKDTLIQDVLGEQFAQRYIKAKKSEWSRYCQQVTEWELEEYLYRI